MRQVYRLLLFVVGNLKCLSTQSTQPPRWNSNIYDAYQKPENLSPGSELVTISAEGQNGVAITLEIYGTETERRVFFNYTRDGTKAVGTVYLKEEMDREEIDTWKLYFKAYDSKIGVKEVREEKLTIYITDINDNAPKFTEPFYQQEVFENEVSGYKVIEITASDPDNSLGGLFSLRLQPAGQSAHLYQGAFSISQGNGNDKNIGTVTLKRRLDYELLSFYQYLIIATDHDPNRPLSSYVTLVIKVKDIQDSPPYFQGLPYVTEIEENVDKNTPLSVRGLAIDSDIGVPNKIRYSFKSVGLPDSEDCRGLFRIDQSTGTVYTNTANLDRDDKPINDNGIDGVCRLTLEAKELNSSGLPQYGNDTTTTPFVITILDENDNLPKFNYSVYQAQVDENTTNIPLTISKPEGIVVTDIDQTGHNEFDISVQYLNGSDFDGIKPDPKSIRGSGNIQLRLTNEFMFDFEVNKAAEYRLVATEKGKSNASSEQTCLISITINDINDNYPVFTSSSYTAYAEENLSDKPFESKGILNVTATDLDSGIRGNITFTLGGDPHFSVSKLNATTAEIRTIDVTSSEGVLDRETRDKYYLTIEASDGEGGRSNARINVFITDLNDNPPVFVQGYRQFSVKENQPTFDSEIVINATDNDQKNLTNSHVKYKLHTPSYLENNFTIDTITGNITLSSEIDFEGLNRIDGKVTLTVEAYDLGSPSMSTNESIDINFQDVNDNVPEFTNQTFILTIVENADSGTHVGTVSATDKDGTPTNSKLTYYIDKGDREKFRMNGATGDITVDHGAKIDREEYTMYNITVLAIDRGTPSLNSSALLFINITDQNDAKPKFNQSTYVTSVNESADINTTFTVCPASDKDLDSLIMYSIIKVIPTYSPGAMGNESANNYFGITKGGLLFVKSGSVIDREVIYHVQLKINVTDVNGVVNVPQTDSALVEIGIEDTNDSPPEFNEIGPVLIYEGTLGGHVFTLTAIDPDLNSILRYSIVQNPLNAFDIDPITGLITRNKLVIIDREKNETLIMNVSVTDSLHTIYTNINLTIQDVNDNNPIFTPSSFTTNLTENNGSNIHDIFHDEFVFAVAATDADSGNNAMLTYTIVEGNFDNVFRLNNTNVGNISVSGNVDREKRDMYILTIEANDHPVSDSRTGTATVTIYIKDVNDNAPTFEDPYYFAKVLENARVNETLQELVVATDGDSGPNQTISYSFTETEVNITNLFGINETTGQIRVKSSLRNRYGDYFLTITATDHGVEQLSGSTNYTIHVEDLNDNIPRLIDPPTDVKIYECARLGTTLVKLNATDDDYEDNGLIEFYFLDKSGDPNSTFFIINNKTGKISTALYPLVHQHKYLLRVQVRDHGDPPLTSPSHDMEVEIIDVNDHPPDFKKDSTTAEVFENVSNITFTKVTAHDEDENSVIRYSIVKNFNALFDINEESGRISIMKEIDREEFQTITIRVRATDITERDITVDCDNTPDMVSNTTEMDVKITILDQNDNPPQFNSTFISRGIRRTVNLNTLIIDLKTTVNPDPDLGENAVHGFAFNGDITFSSSDLKNKILQTKVGQCPDKRDGSAACITSNGTLSTNILFEENMKGYLLIPLVATDAAGNSTTTLKIYIISDDQTAAMLIYDNKAFVQSNQDEILRILSQITGYEFVADGIESYQQDGISDAFRTYLYFHVIVENGKVASATEAKRETNYRQPIGSKCAPQHGELIKNSYEVGFIRELLEKKEKNIFDKHAVALASMAAKYKISSVQEYKETLQQPAAGVPTTFILIGIIGLLGCIVLLVGFFYCKSISRYQRKLKAATTKTTGDTDIKECQPGTNMYARSTNPLLNREEDLSKIDYDRFDTEDDIESVTSYDSHQFKRGEENLGDEEKGATLDMYEDEIVVQHGDIDALAMVLEQHKQEKAACRESLIQSEKINGHLSTEDFTHSFDNEGFQLSLETTEV